MGGDRRGVVPAAWRGCLGGVGRRGRLLGVGPRAAGRLSGSVLRLGHGRGAPIWPAGGRAIRGPVRPAVLAGAARPRPGGEGDEPGGGVLARACAEPTATTDAG